MFSVFLFALYFACKLFCKPGTPKELQVNLFLSEAVNTNFMNSKVSLGTVVERSADGTERDVKV